MTRAALYLRISQDRTGEHLGIDRQREDCVTEAERLGWDITEVYIDNDRSAYKRRPEYERMLVDIDAGDIDAIIAWHPDRLYRVVKDLGVLVDVCKSNNTQISTVRAGAVDLTTPTGRLVAGLLAQVATYEGEAKADRWRRSWRQGREAGKWAANRTRLYGYTRDGQIIEAEANITREMADRLLGGSPLLTVARWLDDEGIIGTLDGTWGPAGIKRYLTNPIIAGWATLDGEIVAEGTWEPILDRDEWETLRAMLTARTRAYVPRVSSLTKLIACGACGTNMITSSAKRVRTYRCSNRPGINGCGRVSANAEPIEELVYAYTRQRLADDRVRNRIAELRAEPTQVQAEVTSLELRLTELEQQLDEPGVPVKAILRAIDRTKARQDDLMSELASRNLEPLPVGDEWPDDIRRRRALVDLVVKSIEVKPATKPSRHGFDPERVVIVGR